MPPHLVASTQAGSGERKRIAVVGSGVAGLSAAWLLGKAHEVTLYEAEDRIGGHSNTVDAPSPHGPVAVDTGFIVYNEANYPNLTALFAHLNVPNKAAYMSFAVSLDGGALEYSSHGVGALFAQKRNYASPRFWRMIGDVLRFQKEAPPTWPSWRPRGRPWTPISTGAATAPVSRRPPSAPGGGHLVLVHEPDERVSGRVLRAVLHEPQPADL
ncbi:FAD-dependent oxidoreductase [Brevundimonas denitrificans]|uniref:FAD-dependent oxidoreductase n=1 Tax=Brevundimonas denitrificans TaxID=1443434 RepID=UPI00352D2F35